GRAGPGISGGLVGRKDRVVAIRLGAPVPGPHIANRSGPGFPDPNPPSLPLLSDARSFPGRTRIDGHVPIRPRLGLDPRHRARAPAQLTTERCTRHVLAVHPAHSGPPQSTRNVKSAERLVGTGSALGFEKGTGLVA